MRVVKVGESVVEFFDSPDEMPMRRYQRFNKFVMIDNEVGSNFEDYNRRTMKGIELLKKNLVTEAIQEFSNRRQMVFNSFEGYSPKGRALAILVHSIDGDVFNDYSKGSLDKIEDKLNEIGFSYKLTEETVREVKKK